MRGLASYDRDDWPRSTAASNQEELWKIGWGRRDGAIRKVVDGAKGVKGVELRRHPYALLRDTPELWSLMGELLDGAVGDLTREDRRRMSNAEVELVLEWKAAVARKMERDLDRAISKR